MLPLVIIFTQRQQHARYLSWFFILEKHQVQIMWSDCEAEKSPKPSQPNRGKSVLKTKASILYVSIELLLHLSYSARHMPLPVTVNPAFFLGARREDPGLASIPCAGRVPFAAAQGYHHRREAAHRGEGSACERCLHRLQLVEDGRAQLLRDERSLGVAGYQGHAFPGAVSCVRGIQTPDCSLCFS